MSILIGSSRQWLTTGSRVLRGASRGLKPSKNTFSNLFSFFSWFPPYASNLPVHWKSTSSNPETDSWVQTCIFRSVDPLDSEERNRLPCRLYGDALRCGPGPARGLTWWSWRWRPQRGSGTGRRPLQRPSAGWTWRSAPRWRRSGRWWWSWWRAPGCEVSSPAEVTLMRTDRPDGH